MAESTQQAYETGEENKVTFPTNNTPTPSCILPLKILIYTWCNDLDVSLRIDNDFHIYCKQRYAK